MNLVILGAQGSGKGTQAQLLAEKFNLFHMESGDMLREMSKTDERIKDMINNGVIVPDEETLGYIENHLNVHHGSFDNIIFDGYPRTVDQYHLLKDWAEKKGHPIEKVLLLKISEDESVKRLSARRTCEKCGRVYNLITNPPKSDRCECGGNLFQRDDDKPDTIKKRLSIYHNNTMPMIEVIKKDGILFETNGERSIEEIFADLSSEVSKI